MRSKVEFMELHLTRGKIMFTQFEQTVLTRILSLIYNLIPLDYFKSRCFLVKLGSDVFFKLPSIYQVS